MEATATVEKTDDYVEDENDPNIYVLKMILGIPERDRIPEKTMAIYQRARLFLNRSGAVKFGPDALAVLAALTTTKPKGK